MAQVLTWLSRLIPSIAQIRKREIESNQLMVIVAITVAIFYNATFWFKLFSRFESPSLGNITFALTFFILFATITGLLLSILLLPKIAKPVLGILFFSCAAIAYFNGLGVVIEEQMLINVMQTDAREASELFTLQLALHLIAFGLVPTLLVSFFKIRFKPAAKEIQFRVLFVVITLTVALALFFANFRYSSYFGRENRDLRLYINPFLPMLSVKKALTSQYGHGPQFQVLGTDATQVKANGKRTVGIFIVGETARADHFSLNGYSRLTNPKLATQPLINFGQAKSCGTSTAYSVPCIFSFLGADKYKQKTAAQQSNLLDVLNTAGIKTLWRDNNSSCKGVCLRTPSEDLRTNLDPTSKFFNDGENIDDILLDKLPEIITNTQGDFLIVLHQMGSHGPAYFKRYPKSFEQFKPVCQQPNPSVCNHEEINNSYDNTILYTDHIISSAIDLLNAMGSDVNTFLLYASDHGESLGEDGIYLHGMPMAIAPVEQTHIPFMLWLSDGFKQGLSVNTNANETCKSVPVSHDNVVHTILNLFAVKTQLFNESLSLINQECMKTR